MIRGKNATYHSSNETSILPEQGSIPTRLSMQETPFSKRAEASFVCFLAILLSAPTWLLTYAIRTSQLSGELDVSKWVLTSIALFPLWIFVGFVSGYGVLPIASLMPRPVLLGGLACLFLGEIFLFDWIVPFDQPTPKVAALQAFVLFGFIARWIVASSLFPTLAVAYLQSKVQSKLQSKMECK